METNSLVIKHFPVQFTDQDRLEYLQQCGAIEVSTISSKHKKYSLTFALFPNKDFARNALYQLHQQEVMGSLLSVEYAKPKHWPKSRICDDSGRERSGGSEAIVARFLEKLTRWGQVRAPVPAHLRYQYPPPNLATLRNIERLLRTTPRLYTQVLHLINKMNLPCPISDDVSEPMTELPQPSSATTELASSLSESESELSSGSGGMQYKEPVPKLAKKPKKVLKKRLLAKSQVVTSRSSQSQKQKIEDVFEDPKKLLEEPPKKLRRLSMDDTDFEGFGVLHPVSTASLVQTPVTEPIVTDVRNPMEEERLEKPEIKCISEETLTANRIGEKERELLPVFKKYSAGPPTSRLYIKNLAKQTTEEELRFIYSRFSNDNFDIRLMQEGRMKGQAFVTLNSVDEAVKAVHETNGYILNDKPMVVQFGRLS